MSSISTSALRRFPIFVPVVAGLCGCSLKLPDNSALTAQKNTYPDMLMIVDDQAYVRAAEANLKKRRDQLSETEFGLDAGVIGTAVPAAAGGIIGFSTNFVTRFGLAAATLAGIDNNYAPTTQIIIIDQEVAVLRCIDKSITAAEGSLDSAFQQNASTVSDSWTKYETARATLQADEAADAIPTDVIYFKRVEATLNADKGLIALWASPLATLADSVRNATDTVIDQTNSQLDTKLPNAQAYLTMVKGIQLSSNPTPTSAPPPGSVPQSPTAPTELAPASQTPPGQSVSVATSPAAAPSATTPPAAAPPAQANTGSTGTQPLSLVQPTPSTQSTSHYVYTSQNVAELDYLLKDLQSSLEDLLKKTPPTPKSASFDITDCVATGAQPTLQPDNNQH